MLSPAVPITIALVYATVVTYLNRVNAERKHQPWPLAKSQAFKMFVLAHNIFLAVYSTWTAIGMVNAVRLSWPGWSGQYGLAGAVDSLCKIHGVHGPGNAASYNATSSTWAFTNRALHLAADGLTPETTDIGRIWNEGLAFYGWLFYLSKFYEIIDTFIILAKGKKSSFLQTYHHAGAMLCMWAGIRYMSPPIWMFVTVNSSLHGLMYTYFTVTAMGVKVPKTFKKTLTTLQITQFIIGATYAFSHLFVAYQIPVSVPYIYHLGDVASSVSSDVSSAVSVATATASAGLGAWLKKAAFRAAGREGLAENVINEQGQTFGIDAVHAAQDLKAREEVRYRDDLQWVNCLDTSGQVFAILLNCMYLAPLTWLFLRFFARAYSRRQARRRSSAVSDIARMARDAGFDAFKGVTRNVGDTFDETEAVDESAVADESVPTPGEVMKKDAQNAIKSGKKAAKEGQDSFEDWAHKVADKKNKLATDLNNKKEEAQKEPSASDLADQMKDVADSVKKNGE